MDKSLTATLIVEGGEKPTLTRKHTSLLESSYRSDSVMDKRDVVNTVPQDPGVRVLELHEWKAAAASLAESFAEDHCCSYFVNTPDTAHWTKEQKWDLHVRMMEYIVYAHLLRGLAVTAGPNYDCVGLWMPPGANMDDLLTLLRSGLWRLVYQLSREGRTRFYSEFLPLLHDTKARVLGPEKDNESWYLVYIGTLPPGRGKGYAKKVIEYITAKADVAGQVCYLESSHEVNRIIYGKLGFQVQKMIYLQRAEEVVGLDIMVREPVMKRNEGD
ncbi:hypothetical protein LTR78_002296 [Recurvomyces mirabilis]|uniref:N-acetyltransferase domain-containing protein n=1 Tax=Recurvomyces mirabilis TaxID=574656 RepID=A0AAE1C501_9PEZI|nr:hypothetical protein LTR78_002296 [Recurvomyces mirabilis]KAK5160751.1 hypothetical protein LTS14_001764 [Recurvomyces mirabilis]